MYLGGATKMGFLSSGGKWRKKDWWQNYKPDVKDSDREELERIKQQEMDLIYESAGAKREKVAEKTKEAPPNKDAPPNLSAYEWNEIKKRMQILMSLIQNFKNFMMMINIKGV